MADSGPSFLPSLVNYALLIVSFVFVTIGSALCWSRTGSVTVDTNAQKSANYYIIGFFYVWVVAACIVYCRLKFSRATCSALYLLLGGLVFELVTRNQIVSYAYGNMWRIYSVDITRMTVMPTSTQVDAVKALLAGTILGHFGVLLAVLAAALHYQQNFSLRGTYYTFFAWLLAIPGIITLFTTHAATLESVNSSTDVYTMTWLIVDTALGILLIQTAGMLFDVLELVAAGVVIAGTHGVFLLGDMFSLQFQRSRFSEYDGDGAKITAGGVLCALAVVSSFWGGVVYFNKRHVEYRAA